MSGGRISIERLDQRLRRDANLTIARFFWPGSTLRAASVMARVMALDEGACSSLLASCLDEFGERHDDLPGIFDDHYAEATSRLVPVRQPTAGQRRLMGAYFTMEYAYASAAFFNPSMVPALDQRGLPPGSTRFIMSVRAVGEGHVSSIVFRTGVIDAQARITIDQVPTRSRRLKIVENRAFDRAAYLEKLIEAGGYTDLAGAVLDRLGASFTTGDLEAAIGEVRAGLDDPAALSTTEDDMRWLSRSNYQIKAPDDAALSQLVLFPLSDSESNGLEDMRLCRFAADDGRARYYGTYTAYNGSCILSQLLELSGPRTAEVHTLRGRYAGNKGAALFPRRVGGCYAIISRYDGENLWYCTSDNVRFWNEGVLVQEPRHPWEFVQIGNCGSPLETKAGWLLLTHGVGPMRRYGIGATLLDLEDPTKVIGRTAEPLLVPRPEERGGYVPNVVYSCGAMIHGDALVIPYGISDVETGFAVAGLDDLLEALSG